VDANEPRLLDVAESDAEISETSEDETSILGDEKLTVTGTEEDDPLTLPTTPQEDSHTPAAASTSPAVRRWLSVLRRRKKQKQTLANPRSPRTKAAEPKMLSSSPAKRRRSMHKPSDSQGSSMAFVTAVKSATATIASASIATVSRRTTPWRRGQQRSSLVSETDPRPSIDSQRSILDEAARQRSRKRRAKLEELIRSEESYLADIKALGKVCSHRRETYSELTYSRRTPPSSATTLRQLSSRNVERRRIFQTSQLSMTISSALCTL
jgi:hypothetical protein